MIRSERTQRGRSRLVGVVIMMLAATVGVLRGVEPAAERALVTQCALPAEGEPFERARLAEAAMDVRLGLAPARTSLLPKPSRVAPSSARRATRTR